MTDILENPEDYKSLPGLEHKLPSLEDSLDEIDKYADELNWQEVVKEDFRRLWVVFEVSCPT